MRNDIIRECNVAVVGGAGFLGSHLVNHLVDDRKCPTLVIDNLVVGKREYINPNAMFEYADITHSEDYLYRLFKQYEIEYVFNYAAYPYIPDSFARPLHVFSVNANGALNVINAAHEAGVKAILQVSSAEIYGDTSERLEAGESYATRNIDEDAPVVPHSTYGAAKAAIDSMVQVRWKENGTPCIALRQFNCVGERETHPYIVPEIISQLTLGDSHNADLGKWPRVFLGNNSFRDFLYAGDQACMAVELLEKGAFGEVYNLGSESGIFMYDLAKLIGEIMGFKDVIVVEDEARKRPWEIWHLLSDNAKIYNVIKHRPTYDLGAALAATVMWYDNHGKKWGWQ